MESPTSATFPTTLGETFWVFSFTNWLGKVTTDMGPGVVVRPGGVIGPLSFFFRSATTPSSLLASLAPVSETVGPDLKKCIYAFYKKKPIPFINISRIVPRKLKKVPHHRKKYKIYRSLPPSLPFSNF